MSHGDIMRSLYVNLTFLNLISTPEKNLNTAEFGRNPVDSVLLLNRCIVTLPEIYPVICGCKKKCTAICHCSKFSPEFCKWLREKRCT